jgi:8-oxo-dGTP pyrophosphatase MutT (NUDIX family)
MEHLKQEMINSVAAILIGKKNRFLLQKRDDVNDIYFPGYWGLFGGKIENFETSEDAIRREIFEELGVFFEDFKYFLEIKFRCPKFDNKIHKRIFFKCHTTLSEVDFTLGEGEDLRYFSIDELPPVKNLVPFDLSALLFYNHINYDYSETIDFSTSKRAK